MTDGQPCISRRAAAAALCLGLLGAPGMLGASATHAAMADSAKLLLQATGAPGGLRIINAGAGPATIVRAIAVEAQTGATWRATPAEFNAIARCGDAATAAAVRIESGAVLDIVPWLGFSCSGQCPRPCRANVRYAAGRYRFVVTLLPGGARVTGPEFWLSAAFPSPG